MTASRPQFDTRTQAAITIAWVIILNKPFYPLYVWYLTGTGVIQSLATLLAAPLYFAIPFIARRSALAARTALPLIGTLDTLFETKLFGQGSGTELFFAACIMLVSVCFEGREKWWQRGCAVLVFAVFLFSRWSIGAPLHVWSDEHLASLFTLNAFAVASLMAFVALRFAGLGDRIEPKQGDFG